MKNLKQTLTVPDIALLLFLIIAALSTALSDYVFESFRGNEGRFSGLFLLLLYGISFFIISRLSQFKSWYLELFLVSSVLVCAFGITDYFNLNVLHFKNHINPKQYNIFMSFMGNINTYTAYLSLVLGVSGALFAAAKKAGRCVWYFLCLVLSLFAIVTGQNDNAYLALLALFAALPFYMFRSRTGVRRYLVILASFFSVIQLIEIINGTMPDQVLEIQGIFSVLANFNGLPFIAAALWAAAGVLYARNYILKIPGEALGKRPVRVWGMFVMLCLALLIFVLFDANIAGHGARYGPLSSYVVIAALFAVLCYGAQAFVNINLPIAAPVMWTLLMLGAAGCRDRETDAAHRA